MNENNPVSFWKAYEQLSQFDDNVKHKNNPISHSKWVSHFSQLMNHNKTESDESFVSNSQLKNKYINIFDQLSFKIKEKEVMDSITSLKNNKAADLLGFKGEMLKAGISYLLRPVTKLFNLIFTNSSLPDVWRESSLTPIHKKGDCFIPSNYRGIAISNILCKVLCKILNTRLNNYLEKNTSIPVNQIGFKQNSRTVDHILALKTLIDKYTYSCNNKNKKYLYACFVDLKSAFDTVWRDGLFNKISQLGIGGIFLAMLKNIYNKVYFRIKLDGMISERFESNIGVKQGCVISPTLFNIYLADICNIFNDDCAPVKLHDIKLNCLLYADDMILLSESATGLQTCLSKLSEYFDKWKLKVNIDKTKIVIFNKGGCKIKRFKFMYKENIVEIVNSYQYLGLVFNSNGNFNQAVNVLHDKGRKAIYTLFKKIPNCNAKVGIRLFNVMILPILTYGCEVWGSCYLNNLKPNNLYHICEKPEIEKAHLKYMKFILGVHSKSANDGVRGELGEFPILIKIIKQITNYWLRISKMPLNSIIYKCYLENRSMLINNKNHATWLKGIDKLLNYCCLENVFTNEIHSINDKTKNTFSNKIQNKLKYLYTTDWENNINRPNSKLRTYSLFKNKFCMEKYLLLISDKNVRSSVTRLRISAHKLKIETGRHHKPYKIAADERYCIFCNDNSIENEIHFILTCKHYKNERQLFLKTLNKIYVNEEMSLQEKFISLMSNTEHDICNMFAKYIFKCTKKEKTLLHRCS